MTSAGISNLLAKKTAAAVNPAPTAGKAETNEDAQAVFSSLMNQTQQSSNVSYPTKDTKSDVPQTVKLAARSDTKKIRQAEDATGTEKMKEKLTDQTEQFADDVKNVIEEELDVTEDEIEKAMEELGLTMIDLTDPSKLAQLVADLTGSTDQTSLLMSDSFQNILQQVETLTTQMMQDLGIEDVEQLGALVEELLQTGEQQPDDRSSIADEAQTSKLVEAGGTNTDTLIAQTATQNTDAESAQETEETIPLTTQEQEAGQAKEAEAFTGGQEQDDTGLSEQRHSHETAAPTENQTVGQFTRTMVETVQPTETVPVGTMPQIDVESILSQIAEFSKTVATQEGTTLQMQLNPENLGKIYMQISTTKEGNVTAQLAAQSEAVKEALEAQVATLRENLNQQGVKVDAIEVTVSTHEFERNLEQNARQQEQQGEQQEADRGTGRRNLNLNNLDDLQGLMSEEEVLAAKIMQQNGNSMDVTI